MESHSHLTTEQHFVLRGSYTSEGKTYPEGSYQIFYAHEEHGPFHSENGAMVLVIWDPYNKAE
jgi:anti-sigma factor ChrR (cupin superfamily)